MEKFFAKAEDLVDNIKEYVHTRIDTVKLNTAERSSTVIAGLVAGVIVAVFVSLALVFAGIALSLVLGAWLGKTWAGFVVVAGFFLLMALVAWAFRGKLIRIPVMNAIIQQFFKAEQEDEED